MLVVLGNDFVMEAGVLPHSPNYRKSLFSCLNTHTQLNRPISVYRFPRLALTLCPQLCTGSQPGARFPARSADALPATLHGAFHPGDTPKSASPL